MMLRNYILKFALCGLALVALLGCVAAAPSLAAWVGWPADPLDKFLLSAIAAGVVIVALPFCFGDGADDWFGGSGDSGGGDGGGD